MTGFWSDDFDMDLPKVLPDLAEILGDTANVRLWTYGGTSHGRLNHPSVWNDHAGMVAFFGTDDTGAWKPAEHYTSDPMVECTWLEAVRDAWPHQYVLLVNGEPVWDTHSLTRPFMDLMYHRRGWRTIPDAAAEGLIQTVRASLQRATQRMAEIAAEKV